MVKTRTVEMQTQLVGYEFKKKGLDRKSVV